MAPFTPERLRAEVVSALDASRQQLDAFLALPTDAPADEVVLAFDRIARPLDESYERVGTFSSVHPDESVRDAAEQLEQEIVSYFTELSLHRGAYERLVGLDAASTGGPVLERVLRHALRDFRRSGVDRDEPTRERVRALQDELVEVGQTFDRNIIQGQRRVRIEDGHAGLAGLPPDYLAAHHEEEDGSVTITTDAPDLLPFLLYAERSDLRQQLMFEFQNRAYPENLEVLDTLLAKRHELATLLGYESWAAYVTEDKMVSDVGTVRAFIGRVSELAQPKAREEYEELLAEKRKTEPGASEVFEWERAFLTERVKLSRFDFDSQSVRPYFSYSRVQQGVLDTSARLYGVEFRKNSEIERWHDDVECFDIVDGGEVVARFYLDMFPREGKYKHAAMFSMRHGIVGETLPEAALVCNFPKPTADDPALLMHTQVTTFFHEFGHLLHHLFAGRQSVMKFSGISTEWDFVEVPSQMYEEWAWDADVLQTFAMHHETGEPIPTALVDKLRAAEEYAKGIQVSMQMAYSMISLSFYDGDPRELDTTRRMRELREEMTPFRAVEGGHFQAGFGHLNGYTACYYTYMWSLVIAKDLFSAFRGNVMDVDVASDYRAKILAPGGTRDAAELVKDFLGRDYEFDAYEAWLES